MTWVVADHRVTKRTSVHWLFGYHSDHLAGSMLHNFMTQLLYNKFKTVTHAVCKSELQQIWSLYCKHTVHVCGDQNIKLHVSFKTSDHNHKQLRLHYLNSVCRRENDIIMAYTSLQCLWREETCMKFCNDTYISTCSYTYVTGTYIL